MNRKMDNKMPILLRFAISIIFVLVISILIVAVILLFYVKSTQNTYHKDLKQQCDIASNNVASHVSRLAEQSNIPIYREPAGYDTSYLSELKNSIHTTEITLSYYNAFLSTAKLIYSGNADIHSVHSYNKNLDVLVWETKSTDYPSSIDPEIWKEQSDLARGGTVFLGALQLSDGSYVYAVSRALLDAPHLDTIGYFIITEKITNLQKACDKMLLTDSQTYQIVDSAGNVISASKTYNIGSNYSEHVGYDVFQDLIQNSTATVKIDGSSNLLVASPIAGTDWFVISSVESNQISNELQKTLITVSLSVIILFATVSIFSIYMFYSSVVIPVNTLISTIQKSGIIINTNSIPHNEVNFLTTSYNQLKSVIENLQSDNYLAMLRRKQLEIELLQVQINPHFLYNTLESIRMMAEIHNDTESAEMTFALSKILRYSIGTGDKITTLNEEISVVKDYVFLQQHRIDNIESFQIDIPDMYGDVLIPKLVLQPLVENAIAHGLHNIKHPGIISLYCVDSPSRFSIAVSDNGSGIPADRLADLNQKLSFSEERNAGSIGLRNVNRRLKLLFGDDYGLRIESTIGQGTTIFLDLPPIERTSL